MTLRQIVLNRRGTIVAFVVAISALLGGALAALLIGLPLKPGWRWPLALVGIHCQVFC